MNIAVITGRLGRDIDMRYTQSGTAVARFTLAVDRYKKGEKDTDWINVTAFGSQAENANKFLHKGSKCGVVGSIKTGSYERQDGTKQYTSEVWANNIEFLDNKSEQGEPATVTVQREQQEQFSGFQPVDEESIPFKWRE
jgi:single-strand DNA-binding protein